MARRIALTRVPRTLVGCDALAILVFVTIGLLSHHRGLSVEGYARDALPLAGGWFGAAALFHLYADRRPTSLLLTWSCGIPAGVLLRALVSGRSLNGGEAAFLVVCLATIGALVLAGRATLRLAFGVRALA